MKHLRPTVLVLAGLFLAGCDAAPKQAPSWTLPGVDGKAVRSAEFAGKVVLLDFWATWCPPCKMEIPGFIELQKQYADKGLVVVGVSIDQDGPSVVREFVKAQGINDPIVMGDAAVQSAFGGIEGVPTTFLIDRTGKIVQKHVGYTSKEEFEAAIKKLL